MELAMDTIGAYEAKTHFSKLLEEVAKDRRITITQHGIPVAMLVPVLRPVLDRKTAAKNRNAAVTATASA